MYSHPLSISQTLPRHDREAASDLPPQGNFVRGFFVAIALSVPIWGLIVWGVYELFH